MDSPSLNSESASMIPTEVLEGIKKWKPYIIELEQLVKQTGYGEINVVIRVHSGFVTDVVTVTKTRKSYRIPKREIDNQLTTS